MPTSGREVLEAQGLVSAVLTASQGHSAVTLPALQMWGGDSALSLGLCRGQQVPLWPADHLQTWALPDGLWPSCLTHCSAFTPITMCFRRPACTHFRVVYTCVWHFQKLKWLQFEKWRHTTHTPALPKPALFWEDSLP